MKKLPKGIIAKLAQRNAENAFRKLPETETGIDFSSNDYLGFSRSQELYKAADSLLKEEEFIRNGATGSRLITGNYSLYQKTEQYIANVHQVESALLFNSGFDANIGFFSCVPQRNDVILFDEYAHASIRQGIQMSTAKAYKFQHNNLNELKEKLEKYSSRGQDIFVVTESIFSMDGDAPNLENLIELCNFHGAFLVVDEAHALGVFGKNGEGLLQHKTLAQEVFARIVTHGKALGAHGAAILGSQALTDYLVNFAKSFIYTTALPPHSVATIQVAYQQLKTTKSIEKLQENISFFKGELKRQQLQTLFIESNSAIQCCIVQGNEKVKHIAEQLQAKGFLVKAILSPTVPKGSERLRFCVHSYNSTEEIFQVLHLLATFVR